MTREAAIWLLAQRLHWKMEHLDPTEDPEWEGLSAHQREFYRILVDDMLREAVLMKDVLAL